MAEEQEISESADGEEVPATRRQVLQGGVLVLGGAGLFSGLVPLLSYLGPAQLGAEFQQAEIPADRLGLWQAEPVVVGGRPCFVVRTPEGLHALSGVCTHLGCVVRWQRSRRQFFCPCHGGRFAPDGRVLGGPPPGALPSLAVAETKGKIVVRPA